MTTKSKSKKQQDIQPKKVVEIPQELIDKTYIPHYMKPEFKERQLLKLEINEKQSKENYQNYLRDLYELDERSPYTYIWNDMTKNYSKVFWRTIWEERERIRLEEDERKWQETQNRFENMMLDKLERDKPWLFEDVYSDDDKRKILKKYLE